MQPEISHSQVSIFLKSYQEKFFFNENNFSNTLLDMTGATAGQNNLIIS
jgi:hypothetical protein